MESCNWLPFVKAAVQRNPASVQMAKAMAVEEIYEWLGQMKNVSIYDSKRLSQPDEVANYKTGDGLEKAFVLANVIRERNPEQNIDIIADGTDVILKGQGEHRFVSAKGLKKQVSISATERIVISD